MKVYIDPSCDIFYSSFYVKGLYDYFNKSNVSYSSRYFKNFKHNNHYFAFVVKNIKTVKVIVDFTDSSRIDEEALAWSDVYGKVNLAAEDVHKSVKIIPIGPGFGFKLYSTFRTLWYALINLLRAWNRIPDKRKFLSDYKAQLKRLSLEEYKNSVESRKDFVYFVSSLWKKEKQTNEYRGNFIRACRDNKKIDAYAGFSPRSKNDMSGFEDITLESRENVHDYFNKIKESSFVFNTPAVSNCHGWKLAEFLTLGKAIISTPLSRELPSPLLDNKHILLTDGSYNDISAKIELLINNEPLRKELEINAKNYFDTYLAPGVVIKRILEKQNLA